MHAQAVEANHDVETALLQLVRDQNRPIEIQEIVQMMRDYPREDTKSAIRYMIETGHLGFDAEFRLIFKHS